MVDRLVIYDALYALAAGDEARERELFGSCAPLAREAFERSLIGDEFPVIWFEVPLKREPRFDLHVALSRTALHAGVNFLPGAGNGYDELFRWYAEDEAGGCGLAFAYDVSEGRIDAPAVHVNVNNAPLADIHRFFDLAAGAGAAERYDGFVARLPQGWRVWYTGVHPARPGSPVRVDCFVDHALKEAYAADPNLFERDLRAVGFEASGPILLELAKPILASPFGLELQFDVMGDGRLGTTLGISASFGLASFSALRRQFEEGGPAVGLMQAIERLGLSDGRWQRIMDASYATMVPVEGGALMMYCSPTFVKLRLRDGEPLDAKVYYQASANMREL